MIYHVLCPSHPIFTSSFLPHSSSSNPPLISTVLDVARNADEKIIKKAHRKKALKYHPDKNYGDEEAGKEFRLVQEAYECLSDPAERKYYDEHRESILRGVKPGDNVEDVDFLFDVTPYHFAGCYDGYGDEEGGFFDVFSKVFWNILEGEKNGFISEGNIDEEDRTNKHLPSAFGNGSSDWKDVSHFYNCWESFSSCLSFAWADKYDPRDAESRWVRRKIDDENKKARRVAKRERNDNVIQFVAFVKKRDLRVKAAKERAESEKRKKEVTVKESTARRKVDAAAAREAWLEEREIEMLETEEQDLNAGRIRLADLDDSDDEFYSRKGKKGKKGRKGKRGKNKPQWSSDEEEEIDSDGDGNGDSDDDIKNAEGTHTDEGKEDTSIENAEDSKQVEETDVKGKETNVQVVLEELDLAEEEGEISDSSFEEEDLEPKVWKCEFCKKTFKSEAQFDNHLKSKKHKETFKKFQKKNKE